MKRVCTNDKLWAEEEVRSLSRETCHQNGDKDWALPRGADRQTETGVWRGWWWGLAVP